MSEWIVVVALDTPGQALTPRFDSREEAEEALAGLLRELNQSKFASVGDHVVRCDSVKSARILERAESAPLVA